MRRALDEKNEHKSMAEVKKTISVNRRMPNCTTVVQTTSDLFQLEI